MNDRVGKGCSGQGCRQQSRWSCARISRILRLLIIVISAGFGSAVAAEPAADDADAEHQSGLVEETPASSRFGFNSTRSVEGTLAETDERQREGPLERFRARIDALEARTGLSYGFDNFTQYLGTDSDKSPSDAAARLGNAAGLGKIHRKQGCTTSAVLDWISSLQ